LFLQLYRSRGHQEPVLVMARSVPAGRVITRDDLAVADVSASGGVSFIPTADARTVIGQVAQVALAPGSLLTRAQVGPTAALDPGQGVIAISIPAGQVPPGVRPENHVRLLVLPKPAATDATASAPAVSDSGTTTQPVDAVVVSIGTASDNSGTQIVSLRLPQTSAPGVAAAAADKRVAIMLVGQGGG
jgi:hypothetical protein